MATSALVSVEEYLRRTEKPNAEYRDGVVYPKPMATSYHGLIQLMLGMLLTRLGLHAGSEITLRLSATKYLVPDIIADHRFQHPYPTEPVLLCCEILSPSDHLGAMLAKCEEYHEWGVPYCWVIDPEKRTAWEYPRNGEPVKVVDALHAGEIVVNLSELFSAIKA
jgi:Uma2 family endonuclease